MTSPSPSQTADENLLAGKSVVITGAANGIGKATAFACARAGAKLVLGDSGGDKQGRHPDGAAVEAVAEQLREAGYTALGMAGCVTEPAFSTSLTEACIKAYGAVDAFACCAGISQDRSLLRMTEEEFDQVVAVQLKGTFLGIQAAARAMRTNKAGGSIITTLGVAGLQGNLAQANASAANGGVYGLLRTASIELQKYGVRVNGVAPIAKTRLTEDLPLFEQVSSMSPEHVASVYVYLASPLSREQSGTVLAIAGGRLSTYKLTETTGEFKDSEDGLWRPAEIAEYFGASRKG